MLYVCINAYRLSRQRLYIEAKIMNGRKVIKTKLTGTRSFLFRSFLSFSLPLVIVSSGCNWCQSDHALNIH
jgi:hypothetical protein